MKKSILVATALSCALSGFALTPSYLFAEETAQTLSTEEVPPASSWRYSNGEPIDLSQDEDGISLQAQFELAWTKGPDGYYNSLGGIIPDATRKGIDVSSWQYPNHTSYAVNWAAVKASDVDFAILRCGYAGNQVKYDDPYWKQGADACTRLGIPFGAYLYSYANSVAGAVDEANHALRLLEGYDLSYPIYLDMEDASTLTDDDGNPLTPSDFAAIAKMFCSILESHGYEVGVYANLNWWRTYLTDPVFDSWDRWVAQYNYECTYSGAYGMWQSTSSGSVPGIEGNVDIDFEIGGLPDDVNAGDWYYDAYKYVSSEGIMTCYTGTNLFGSHDNVTRGQVATILWRLAGEPAADQGTVTEFDDNQNQNAYYYEAVRWAQSKGIVNGYENEDGTYTNFGPNDYVTREDLAVMIANYARIVERIDVTSDCIALNSIIGSDEVRENARTQLGWAVDSGLISGVVTAHGCDLRPKDQASRAVMATIMMRFMQNIL